MEEIIKYGDTVVLHDFVQKGYLTARRQAICQIMVEVNDFSVSAAGVPPIQSNPYPRAPDPADSCFRVTPKLAYSKYNAFVKATTGIKDPTALGVKLTPTQIAAQKKMAEERVSNTKLIAKMRGAPVIYGATIQLYHERTGSYVTLQKERADIDMTKLKVSLDNQGNKNSWFNFNPGYKTGKMGETVKYPNVCVLTSTKNDVNVHVSSVTLATPHASSCNCNPAVVFCHVEGPTGIPSSHEYVKDVLEVNGYVTGAIFRVFPYR